MIELKYSKMDLKREKRDSLTPDIHHLKYLGGGEKPKHIADWRQRAVKSKKSPNRGETWKIGYSLFQSS